MPSTATHPHCSACVEAETLVDHYGGVGKTVRPRRSSAVMADVSVLIYGALSTLLSDFDYRANDQSTTAKAARMLALAAARMSRADARSAQVRVLMLNALRE
jgi:hypothetical protein